MTDRSTLPSQRLLFITGKGGVGKTTVMATYALALASQGKRVLCAMCQAKDRLSTLFGLDTSIGSDIVRIHPGIDAVNMDPEAALREYGLMVLRVRALHRAVFYNPLVMSFFRATPGLYSWGMLGKAWFHSTQKRRGSKRYRYDTVLVDAPSTGHALEMLRGPKVIVDVAPAGLLRREAAKAWNMFSDPAQFGVVLVTLAQEMPVTETLELVAALKTELKLPIAQLIVNGVIPPLFSPHERELLVHSYTSRAPARDNPNNVSPSSPTTHTSPSETSRSPALWTPAVRRAERELVQMQALDRLRQGTDLSTLHLPYHFRGIETLEALEAHAAWLKARTTIRPMADKEWQGSSY